RRRRSDARSLQHLSGWRRQSPAGHGHGEREQELTQGIARLNALSSEEAQAELLKCCGSTNWARRMAQQRPFPTGGDAMRRLLDAADRVWWDLSREDWLEAFSRHPRIGEKAAAKDASAETRRWSEEEQSGTRSAREQRSEEHTSELQSPCNLVCRLLLEKKKSATRCIRLRTSCGRLHRHQA